MEFVSGSFILTLIMPGRWECGRGRVFRTSRKRKGNEVCLPLEKKTYIFLVNVLHDKLHDPMHAWDPMGSNSIVPIDVWNDCQRFFTTKFEFCSTNRTTIL